MCRNCQAVVVGNGFTNHCPSCLWSCHVDVQPGDRAESCHGMLEPIGAVTQKGETVIVHRCQRCGEKRRIRAVPEDNQELLFGLLAGGLFS